jgi:hypothetical protein
MNVVKPQRVGVRTRCYSHVVSGILNTATPGDGVF